MLRGVRGREGEGAREREGERGAGEGERREGEGGRDWLRDAAAEQEDLVTF